MCPETFTVDFQGEITEVPMTGDGVLCANCEAPSPNGLHLLEIEKQTQVLDADGEPVTLVEIREVDSPPLPNHTFLVGDALDFTPSGLSFDKRASLTLGHTIPSLPNDAVRVAMAYHGSNGVWNEVKTDATQVADIASLTGDINHFTVFAILAEVPAFEVTNLSIAPSRTEIWPFLTFAVRTGAQAEVSVEVANTGKHEAAYGVTLQLDGETTANHETTLAPGEIEDVVFTLTDNPAGRHFVKVEELTGEFTHSLWINWALIIGLGAGLLIVILLAILGVWWYRRRVY